MLILLSLNIPLLTDCISYTVAFAFVELYPLLSFLRGDPSMVKLNVAITCGYLFYGMNHCFMEVQAQIFSGLSTFLHSFVFSSVFSSPLRPGASGL